MRLDLIEPQGTTAGPDLMVLGYDSKFKYLSLNPLTVLCHQSVGFSEFLSCL